MKKKNWVDYFKFISVVLFIALCILLFTVVMINYSKGYQELCANGSGVRCGASPVYKNENPVLFYEYLIINILLILGVGFGAIKVINFICKKIEKRNHSVHSRK